MIRHDPFKVDGVLLQRHALQTMLDLKATIGLQLDRGNISTIFILQYARFPHSFPNYFSSQIKALWLLLKLMSKGTSIQIQSSLDTNELISTLSEDFLCPS